MKKPRTHHVFEIGEHVACHSPSGYNSGTVTSIEANKVTAVVRYHEYQNDGSTADKESIREYARREKDGLFVSEQSLTEERPHWMLSSLDEAENFRQWRNPTSIFHKAGEAIRTGVILLHWAISRPLQG